MKNTLVYIFTLLFLCSTLRLAAQDEALYDRLEQKGYEIVNIENTGVRAFLDDRSYDDPSRTGDYSFSVVRRYSSGVPSRPAGLQLNWESDTPASQIAKIVVTLLEADRMLKEAAIDSPLYRDSLRFYYPSVDKREYLLSNMCPRKYCYYKVEEIRKDGSQEMLKSGKFYTEGRVRMLRVEGMVNVRDFGGWTSSYGGRTRFGRLFRGNRPDGVTATGKNDFVKNEHLTADLDLRGQDLGKSPFGSPVEYYVTNNSRYKPALAGSSSSEVLARDLRIIAQVLGRGGSVFMHCEHGVNRCGTLSFLIDGLMGLSEADLSRTYELSAFAYGTQRGSTYGAMIPYIRSFGEDGDDLAKCFYNYALHIGVSEETLDTILTEMLGPSYGQGTKSASPDYVHDVPEAMPTEETPNTSVLDLDF